MALRPSGGGDSFDEDPPRSLRRLRKDAKNELCNLHRNGRLTPNQVVEAAKPQSSPLHPLFDWDDSEAAHKWRLEQARTLIRTIKIEVTFQTETIVIPRYVRDPEAKHGQGYVDIDRLRQEPKNAAALMRYEVERALTILERTSGIAQALGINGDVKRTLSQIRRLLAKLS